MKILIIGGDGYLGWPQAMYLSQRGHKVLILDSLMRRDFDLKNKFNSLVPIESLEQRVNVWNEKTGLSIRYIIGDTRDYPLLSKAIKGFRPEAIVHFGEQRTAPFSMIDREHAIFTMDNNVLGTLNVLYAIKDFCPDCHLVKLGTMGEYGTPNIDIEEGYIEIEYKGRKDKLPYPKQPGSFYHLSKAHDSHNIMFASKIWNLRATDLNQGVVYGVETEETKIDPRLATRFDYDQIYGTVLNRFCIQAAIGYPLTVYGKGGQTRSYINIKDTVKCIELAIENPPKKGEFRVFNQFTEIFSINQLATIVAKCAQSLHINAKIRYLDNPRVEAEKHYYNAVNTNLIKLGLEPNYLKNTIVTSLMQETLRHKSRINKKLISPTVNWRKIDNTLEC